jgi:hypothetical protein
MESEAVRIDDDEDDIESSTSDGYCACEGPRDLLQEMKKALKNSNEFKGKYQASYDSTLSH